MQRRLFLLLLLVALVRGVVYLAVVPPWQHNDEPTHFEYASFIARQRRLPQAGDYELEMRREIAASMRATDFWKELGEPPLDLWSDTPPKIGFAELGHPPAYYALVAVPLFLVKGQDIETQLYVARLISVLLYVLVVAAAYGLLRDAFPGRRWLPLVVAAFIALLPTLANLMSSVNNDVGGVAVISLLLWSGIRLLRYGVSLKRLIATLLLAVLCFLTKSTAGIVAMVILFALGAASVPVRFRRWLWIGLALLAVVVLIASFTWGGNAAHWYNWKPRLAENRVGTNTPLGDGAFAISGSGEPYARDLLQEMELSEGQRLLGKTVTLGAWLKAPEGKDTPAILSLREDQEKHEQQVTATADWQFHAFTATVGVDTGGIAIHVLAPGGKSDPQAVYVDGIVLVEGEMLADLPPQFETGEARQGTWNAQPFENLLRNGSAEKVWPGMRGWIGFREIYRQPVVQVFYSLLDWSRTGWVYRPNLAILHDSFWGRFGWGSLGLPPALFATLWLVTLGGIAGTGLAIVRKLRSKDETESWQRWAWILMGAVLLTSWGAAYLRIHPLFITLNLYWPMARYASVAIVPTATVLCLGLGELAPRRWAGWLALLGLLALITLDVVALLLVLVPYYYG